MLEVMSDDRRLLDVRWERGMEIVVDEGRVAVVRDGPTESLILLADKPIVFGRDPGCDVSLRIATPARQHFVITPYHSGHAVFDMQSAGGTFLNNERVGQYDDEQARASAKRLQHGDVITIMQGFSVTYRVGL